MTTLRDRLAALGFALPEYDCTRRDHGTGTLVPIAAENMIQDLTALVSALAGKCEEMQAFARTIPSLECPCCGEEGCFATFFEDGQATICGCGGTVSADGEDAHISIPFQHDCPKCSPAAAPTESGGGETP